MITEYIGNFGSKGDVNGQSVKTLAIEELFQLLGIHIIRRDTSLKPLGCLCIAAVKRGRKHAISLGKRGLTIYLLLSFLTLDWRRERHFFIVGGWFLEYFQSRFLYFLLNRTASHALFYVESQTIVDVLNDKGFNAVLFPNFRNIEPLNVSNKNNKKKKSTKCVFVSRLITEKGIFEAIEMIETLCQSGCQASLDIYGSGPTAIVSAIDKKIAGYSYIKRYPAIEPDNVIKVMEAYDFLILPTFYSGECMPGVVVEAFSRGVPVVTTNWRFMPEMVEHNINGALFSREDFVKAACEWIREMTPNKYSSLSLNALRTFNDRYHIEIAANIIAINMLKRDKVSSTSVTQPNRS